MNSLKQLNLNKCLLFLHNTTNTYMKNKPKQSVIYEVIL